MSRDRRPVRGTRGAAILLFAGLGIAAAGGRDAAPRERTVAEREHPSIAATDDRAAILLRRLEAAGIPVFSVRAMDASDVFRNLDWHDPPATTGPATFISQVIGVAGGRPATAGLGPDWPRVSPEERVRRQTEVIVVAVGDDPAHTVGRRLHAPGWRESHAVRAGRIVELPADPMNRPGPHVAAAARRLRDALHPGGAR